MRASMWRGRHRRRRAMPRVAIVGSGLIGRSWAVVFARGGFDVTLYDAAAGVTEAAHDLVVAALRDLTAHGLADAAAAATRVHVAASLADALDGAALVQENLPEV